VASFITENHRVNFLWQFSFGVQEKFMISVRSRRSQGEQREESGREIALRCVHAQFGF